MHWKAKSTIQMQRTIPYYLKLIQKFLHSLPSMNMWKKGHFLWVWFNLSLGEEAKLGRKGGAVPDISCSPRHQHQPQQRREMCSRGCPGPGSRTPCLASTALSHLFPSAAPSLTESFAACLPSVLCRVVQGETGLPEKDEVGCLAKRKGKEGKKREIWKERKALPTCFSHGLSLFPHTLLTPPSSPPTLSSLQKEISQLPQNYQLVGKLDFVFSLVSIFELSLFH